MSKEKSKVELLDEKQKLQERASAITNGARTEQRMLNKDEEKELGEIQCRMADINIEIAMRDSEKQQKGNPHLTNQVFSLRRAILEMVDGDGYSERTKQMNTLGKDMLHQAGLSERSSKGLFIPVEARASMTAASPGDNLIETDFLDIVTPLRDRLVLSQAGASMMTGLVGNIDIPGYSGSTAEWADENGKAADGAGTFSKKTMKPKRLTSILTVSRQLLVQDSLGVEQMLRADLVNAVASKLEATILGGHTTSAEKPDGFFTGFETAAVDMSWEKIVGLETDVDVANALQGNTAYIMHTKLFGKGKTTLKSTGVAGYLIENGSTNGYNALRTNAVFSKDGSSNKEYGIIFGNWADLLVGQWGALELMVDPYTKADEALVRIIVNSYWDAVPRRDKSFAKALMTGEAVEMMSEMNTEEGDETVN